MDVLILFLRLALATVFVIAAIGKFLDPEGSRKAAENFGLKGAVGRLFTDGLPFIELIIGVGLLFSATSWIASVAASIVLAVFIGGLVYQISRGNTSDCHCFGQLHSAPAGKSTLVRNGLLAAAAVFLLTRGRDGQGLSFADAPNQAAGNLLLFAVFIAAIVTISYLKRLSAAQEKLAKQIELLEVISATDVPKVRDEAGLPNEGVPIGARFPAVTLSTRGGEPLSTAKIVSSGKSSVFLFVTPNCAACRTLMSELAEWINDLGSMVNFVVVTSGSEKENSAKIDFPNGATVLYQKRRELGEAVGAKWTPTALVVRPNGTTASAVAAGDSAIRKLIDGLRTAEKNDPYFYLQNGKPDHKRLKIGQPVPHFALSDLSGQPFSVDKLIGKTTLAVFWSKSCPHCLTMMDQMRKWDRDRDKTPSDPNLIVFSAGEPDYHRGLGLRSPILLEDGYKTASALGMTGTPSGVLIDSNGRFASETAIGAPNIWSLIGHYPNLDE